MKQFITCLVIVLLVALAGILYVSVKNADSIRQQEKEDNQTEVVEPQILGNDKIVIDHIRAGQTVSSPLTITGRARGFWFFEASFPVKLIDSTGTALAITHAQALGEWMTEEFVPFSVTFNFTSPEIGEGFLVFQKDNPSGLPEHDEFFEVPIKFH